MKKVILCSMLAAFAVAVQADDAKATKAGDSKCCEEKTACCDSAKTAKKADSTAKGAAMLVLVKR